MSKIDEEYNNISKFLKIKELCSIKNTFKKGISPATFYRILNDNKYNIGINTLNKIDNTLKLKLQEIKNVIEKGE